MAKRAKRGRVERGDGQDGPSGDAWRFLVHDDRWAPGEFGGLAGGLPADHAVFACIRIAEETFVRSGHRRTPESARIAVSD